MGVWKQLKDKDADWKIPYVGGWCFVAGTLVAMADGSLKNIEDIKVGDKVFNGNGDKINTVINTFNRESNVIEIDVLGKNKTILTPEHPLLSSKPYGFRKFTKPEFIETKELTRGDRIVHSIPNGKDSILTKDELTFLGFFIGDGYTQYGKNNKTKFVIELKKQRKIDFLRSLKVDLRESFNKNNGYTTFALRNKSHLKLKDILLTVGRLAHNKQIPLIFDRKDYRFILDGYLNADGYFRGDGRYKGSTVSNKLAHSLSIAALASGYSFSFNNGRNPHSIIMGRKVDAKPYYEWSLSVKSNKTTKFVYDYETLYVKSVKYFGKQTVYNIDVDGDDTFIANGLYTHNCEGYVEGAWGKATLPTIDNQQTTGVYTSATDAWNKAKFKHYDYPPAGITVPVYFSLGSTPLGHVAIRLDDLMVASTTQGGFHTQGYIHKNIQDLITMYAKYNNGCTYLGWSEDVGGEQMVKYYPDITTKEITEVSPIPFKSIQREDSTLAKGKIDKIDGKDGNITRVYTLTYSDGIETNKVLKSETRVEPITEEYITGTYELPIETVEPATEPVVKPQQQIGLFIFIKELIAWLLNLIRRNK